MFLKGIVEDNNDPLKLGRVRIRVVGKHTDNKSNSGDKRNYLPTSDIPWSVAIFPVTSGAISGQGQFGVPANGSVVVCGYFDEDEQESFYIGTLAVIASEKPDSSLGFSDPSGTNPSSAYMNRSPIHKRATGDNGITKTPVGLEPSDTYAASYPKNNVISTPAGHIVELDDTAGAERVNVYHKLGSWVELDANGNIIIHASAAGKVFLTGKDNALHGGVVTKHCLCSFTGMPHPDWSDSVEASK